MSLDPHSEIETLINENDYLREKLKLAEAKLQASLFEVVKAKRHLDTLTKDMAAERAQLEAEIRELEKAFMESAEEKATA